MRFIADFHIHSHFSIATSKLSNPEYIDFFAKTKGIKLVGTGDFTHPLYLKELQEKLEPAEYGLFKLKDKFKIKELEGIRLNYSLNNETRFILTSEISSIYKDRGRVRKVHNLLFAPDFDTVERLQSALQNRDFNITSDGRPIIGFPSRDLVELALDINENIFFIPAHIWTPWFSALGSKSGFDSIDECYGDMEKYIYAVETGLSSDPAMNRLCNFLDKYTLISNSDAHSPEKLAREANIFDTDIDYLHIINAIKENIGPHFKGTIEFFPQEGKYHYDGHRNCGICWSPEETIKHNGICPVCGRRVTIGVMNRVIELADRDRILNYVPAGKNYREAIKRTVNGNINLKDVFYLIPLKEILSEIHQIGVNSKKIKSLYEDILMRTGSEIQVLLFMDLGDLKEILPEPLQEAIKRMRNNKVIIKEGFDGEFGRIKLFTDEELASLSYEKELFPGISKCKKKNIKESDNIGIFIQKKRILKKYKKERKEEVKKISISKEQKKATEHFKGPALVISGPGSGKTYTIIKRIEYLFSKGVKAKDILVLTFSNKASMELKKRSIEFKGLSVFTFHAFGLNIIEENIDALNLKKGFEIINTLEREDILRNELGLKKNEALKLSKNISAYHSGRISAFNNTDKELFQNYKTLLIKYNIIEMDELVLTSLQLLENNEQLAFFYRKSFPWIIADEYQDINSVQYKLIRILLDTEKNFFAVGDINQSIYGFRGSEPYFITNFKKDFPESTIYYLKKSYRCPEYILRAGYSVLQNRGVKESDLRKKEKVYLKTSLIRLVRSPTEKSEAEFIARYIENLLGGLRFFSMDSGISLGNSDNEYSPGEIAILCRVKEEFAPIIKALNDHAIPFQRVGSIPFFMEDVILLIIDIIRFIKNPKNQYLSKKIVNHKFLNMDALKELYRTETYPQLTKMKVVDIIQDIVDKYIKGKALNSEKRSYIEKLIFVASEFNNDLNSFLRYTITGREQDGSIERDEVSLMTIHAAKGLEFRTVFIPGCENGLIPFNLFDKNIDIEEEKRLLFVAMTRTKETLIMSHSLKRKIYKRVLKNQISPFLKYIDHKLLKIEDVGNVAKKKKNKQEIQPGLF